MYTKMLTPYCALLPGGTMPGSEGMKEPHKHVLSVLESITLSIPMQQGKARSQGKGAMKKGSEGEGVKDR